MAISIHEALQLPVMRDIRLIAGHKGTSNLIKWVTIVEVIEDINRLQEGEFLITTAFGLSESEQKQNDFKLLLSLKKLSGVAIYTGFYLKEIPSQYIEIANENNLPLLEIPTDINFSMITKAILEQIVNNQMQLLEYSLSIHKELTKLVLDNEDPNQIANTLSKLISSPIIIYDELHDIDHIVNKSIDIVIHGTKITLPELEFDLLEKLEECSKNRTSAYFHLNHYHISIHPIIANDHSYGCIVAIKPSEVWGKMDDIAIEHAATIYAIESLKKVAIEETKIRLQGDFLEDIINGHIANKSISIEQGQKLGYDLSLTQTFFYLTFEECDDKQRDLPTLISKLLQIVNQLLKQKRKPFIVRSKLDSLLLLTNVTESNSKKMAYEIEKQWRYFFPSILLKIGIGKSYDDINMLSKSAKEAQIAVSLSGLISNSSSITHFDELGMYQLLINMKKSGIDLKNFYTENIGVLLYNSRQGTDFIETLDTYLKNNQNMQTTATELFIHRHTLKYRLKQIEKKTGIDLKIADDRLRIQLAIMAYKLLYHLEQAGDIDCL
ncbi:PucR family transcriptional regulator [Alkalihalobacillus sp. BA299]|uniref:PucR family transcriptional regulator n=1 Tax=Alkalihalobacillus sp. BA299 TaxID=2815938 RepID=UPI001ADC48EA|nr:PucR family transcriptional regulator [Alkalihalobacillus sp. BA299]